MVEAAIVLPIMIFLILGGLQIMMMQHGRVMAEYAAYNAVRAGIVHNADWNVMRNAALVGALPVYGRTDDPEHLLVLWAKVKAAAEITEQIDTGFATLERLAGDLLGAELPGIVQDLSLIDIKVASPDAAAFAAARQWQEAQTQRSAQLDPGRYAALDYPAGREIDFDDVELFQQNPEASRLAIRVRLLYPLRIPLVNKIIFELWMAQHLLNTRAVTSDLSEWAEFKGRTEGGRNSGQYLDEAVRSTDDTGPTDDFFTTSQWTRELRTLRWVAEEHDIYLLPIYATYAMQMQSNLFESNRREPVWFSR